MSFLGFNIVGTALDTFQQAADTTSNNISNVNTPGASRQTVNITEAPPIVGSPGYATWSGPGTQGTGAIVQSITRVHQDSYDTLFRGASSAQNFYQVQDQQLQAVQAAFAEPSNGINASFTSLQTALSQLSANPTGTPERNGVLAAAQQLVSQLNNVGNAIQGAKTTALQQATAVVAQANNLIDKIAALNGQIRASTAVGDNPNTYEDQRDQYIDQLSQLLSTQTAVQANGSTLVTVGGRALVNDTQVYHLAAPVVGTDASGNPTLVIGFVNDPNPSNPNPAQVGSGQLGGYLDLYNNKLTPYGQKLDNFANAAAAEVNAITAAGYDQNGNPGLPLLQPIVSSKAVSATNIQVGITDPAQVPAALASTAAGTLTQAMNSANNTVNTAANIAGNPQMFFPGNTAAPQSGTLTVTVDGVAQAFAYDFSPTGTDATIDAFIAHFNNAQLGVTVSFDHTSQKMVFTRDPNNVSLGHRAAVAAAGTAVSPDFTLADSNAAVAGSQGTPTPSLLQALGAQSLDGVQQNATNAYGTGDNGGANALLRVFSKNVGVPYLQTTSTTGNAAGATVTIASPAGVGAFSAIRVGQVLTIDAGTANQENVVVSAVNRTTGTITFTAANAHVAGYSITTAQSQTLGSYYGGLVGQLGLDAQTATTGSAAQSTLAANIDKVRQGIDGINLDEETQNLVKYQNSYQAAARTLNVLQQLMQSTLGLIPGG